MKNNFKYILLITLAAVLIMPMATKTAIAQQDIQAQIQALMQQIQALQQQLAQLQAQQGGGTQWCHTFNTNLRIGDQNDTEVGALMQVLEKEKLYYIPRTEIALPGPTTFTEEIASAVTGFQEKYRDEILTPLGLKYGTGFVGKSTRAKLNQLYGCETTKSVPAQECIQVVTLAKNPTTGKCKKFSTPCDIPSGWQKVNSCLDSHGCDASINYWCSAQQKCVNLNSVCEIMIPLTQ